jgi:hypothetical protein
VRRVRHRDLVASRFDSGQKRTQRDNFLAKSQSTDYG